jgi:hypothetical protein
MLCLASALGVPGAIAGCASDKEPDQASPAETTDAAAEAARDTGAIPLQDASTDATPSEGGDFLDAGAPLVVSCAQKPCVTALTVDDAFCALLDTGHVACWGNNYAYQLGRGVAAGNNTSNVPGEVLDVANAVDVHGTCAILPGGVAKCWGPGNFLQTNDGGRTPTQYDQAPTAVTLPLPPVKSVSTNSNSLIAAGGCAALATGELWCWGFYDGYALDYFVDAGGTPYLDYGAPPAKVALPAGFAPIDVAVGVASFARDEAGVVTSWGDRSELGRISSLALDPFVLPIALDGVTALDVHASNVCAVAKGKVYCWGSVAGGTLTRALPVPVLLAEPAVTVATGPENPGSASPHPFACAVTAKHDLWCWGSNEFGQLGDGTKGTIALAPVKIALPGPVVSVRTNRLDTCALLESGQVYCWGNLTGSPTPQLMVMP